MIYNILLYVGMFLIAFGFTLFLYSQYKIREIEKEMFRQEQLHQSFMKGKNDRPNKMGNTPSTIRK